MVNKIFEYWRQKEQTKCLNAFNSLDEAEQIKIFESYKLSDLPSLFNFLAAKLSNGILQKIVQNANSTNVQVKALHIIMQRKEQDCLNAFNSLDETKQVKIIQSYRLSDLPSLLNLLVTKLNNGMLQKIAQNANSINVQVHALHIIMQRNWQDCLDVFNSLGEAKQVKILKSSKLSVLPNLLNFLATKLNNGMLQKIVQNANNVSIQVHALYIIMQRNKQDCLNTFNPLGEAKRIKIIQSCKLSTLPNLLNLLVAKLSNGMLQKIVQSANNISIQVQALHIIMQRNEQDCFNTFNSLDETKQIKIFESYKLSDLPSFFNFLAAKLSNGMLQKVVQNANNVSIQVQALYIIMQRNWQDCLNTFNSLGEAKQVKILKSSKLSTLSSLLNLLVAKLSNGMLQKIVQSANNVSIQVQVLYIIMQRNKQDCLNVFYSLDEAEQIKIFESSKLSTLPNLLNLLVVELNNGMLQKVVQSANNINAQVQVLYIIMQRNEHDCLNVFYSLDEAEQIKIFESSKLSTLPNLLSFLKNKTNKKIMSDMTYETIDEFYNTYDQPNYKETLDQEMSLLYDIYCKPDDSFSLESNIANNSLVSRKRQNLPCIQIDDVDISYAKQKFCLTRYDRQ